MYFSYLAFDYVIEDISQEQVIIVYSGHTAAAAGLYSTMPTYHKKSELYSTGERDKQGKQNFGLRP